MLEWSIRPFRLIAMLALAAPLACACTGCGGAEDETADAPAAQQQPAADPRYATAQGLVDQFNALTTKEPIDMPAVNALFFAENPRQKALCELSEIMVPIVPLNNAMQERFKQPIDPTTPAAFAARANGPAKITQDQGERASATYNEWDGRTETLQLVRYDQRWWISGYTMEHHPRLKNLSEDDLAFMTIIYRGMAAVAPGMIQRIQAGDFRTADEVRKAFIQDAGRHAAQNPADVERMRQIAQRNPKYAAMAAAAAGPFKP